MCDRFHCLPSQLLGEDADLLRLLAIEEMGIPPRDHLGEDVFPQVMDPYEY